MASNRFANQMELKYSKKHQNSGPCGNKHEKRALNIIRVAKKLCKSAGIDEETAISISSTLPATSQSTAGTANPSVASTAVGSINTNSTVLEAISTIGNEFKDKVLYSNFNNAMKYMSASKRQASANAMYSGVIDSVITPANEQPSTSTLTIIETDQSHANALTKEYKDKKQQMQINVLRDGAHYETIKIFPNGICTNITPVSNPIAKQPSVASAKARGLFDDIDNEAESFNGDDANKECANLKTQPPADDKTDEACKYPVLLLCTYVIHDSPCYLQRQGFHTCIYPVVL
jgi:hypothetical protein